MNNLIRRDADGTLVVSRDFADAVTDLARHAIGVDGDSVNRALAEMQAHWAGVLSDLVRQVNDALSRVSAGDVHEVTVRVVAEPPTRRTEVVRKEIETDDRGRITAIVEHPVEQ